MRHPDHQLGHVYYAFPVPNPQITATTGWSTTATTAAFSGTLLVSALTGIPVGRILDRRGPHAVRTTGSVLGVIAVLGLPAAPNLAAFTAAWPLACSTCLDSPVRALTSATRPVNILTHS